MIFVLKNNAGVIMKRAIVLAVILFMGCVNVVWAFDFSADVVSTAGGRTFNSKIYVSNDKTRMEAAGATTISRMDKKVVWVIMPQQNMYMEQPVDLERASATTEKMPGEIERTPLGADTVDGKAVEKYRIRYTSNGAEAVMLQWIDPKTKIPLKTASEDGKWIMEYKNLIIGPQPEDLFNVPAGYKKFAMPDMKEMMRAAQAGSK